MCQSDTNSLVLFDPQKKAKESFSLRLVFRFLAMKYLEAGAFYFQGSWRSSGDGIFAVPEPLDEDVWPSFRLHHHGWPYWGSTAGRPQLRRWIELHTATTKAPKLPGRYHHVIPSVFVGFICFPLPPSTNLWWICDAGFTNKTGGDNAIVFLKQQQLRSVGLMPSVQLY